MKLQEDYDVVSANNISDLINEIRLLQKDKWIAIGGIAVESWHDDFDNEKAIYYQTIVKEVE